MVKVGFDQRILVSGAHIAQIFVDLWHCILVGTEQVEIRNSKESRLAAPALVFLAEEDVWGLPLEPGMMEQGSHTDPQKTSASECHAAGIGE